jgi:hypothetical protein
MITIFSLKNSLLEYNQKRNKMSKENFSQEAVQKMKEMIMSIDFTMFTTALIVNQCI